MISCLSKQLSTLFKWQAGRLGFEPADVHSRWETTSEMCVIDRRNNIITFTCKRVVGFWIVPEDQLKKRASLLYVKLSDYRLNIEAIMIATFNQLFSKVSTMVLSRLHWFHVLRWANLLIFEVCCFPRPKKKAGKSDNPFAGECMRLLVVSHFAL